MANDSQTIALEKVRQIFKICMRNDDSENKVNVMLRAGWKILDRYNEFHEWLPNQGESTLYYILGHEDADAEIPMTEYEFKNTPEQISYFLQNQPFPPSFSRNQE